MTKCPYNDSVFSNEDDISFYLLGLFITDGNISLKPNSDYGEASITSIDLEVLEKIRALVKSDLLLAKKKDSNCYRLRINNKPIVDWLRKFGVVPNKTIIVEFPNIPKVYLPDLIRGLIDGDGSIGCYNNKPMIRFDSASLSLITGVSNVLKDWNLSNKIVITKPVDSMLNGRPIKTTTPMYRIALDGLKAYKLLKIIYKNNRLSILRKRVIAESIISNLESIHTEKVLLSVNRIPNKNAIKWPSDKELVNLCIKHKGVFAEVAKEFNSSGWVVSQRLRKINKYNFIRNLYPYVNINNLKVKSNYI